MNEKKREREFMYQTKQKKIILKDNLYDVPKPLFDTGVYLSD